MPRTSPICAPGLPGAVACKYLAPKKRITLGIAGTGRQAEAQVLATAEEREIEQVLVWSRNPRHAEEFARKMNRFDCVEREPGKDLRCRCPCHDNTLPYTDYPERMGPRGHAYQCDRCGCPGKEELDPALLQRSQVFVDDMAQATHSGEINVPISKGLYSEAEIAGTLGEVVIGKKQRRDADAITIFDSTGLAIQDLAIATIAMKHGNPDRAAVPVRILM